MQSGSTTFKIIDEHGNEIECEILFTYYCEEHQRHYLAYSELFAGRSEKIPVYFTTYDPNNPDDLSMKPLETKEGENMIAEILEDLLLKAQVFSDDDG